MFKNHKFLIILTVILIGGLIFSSYFILAKNSNIIQSSQIQPLIADSEHDVVVMEVCDLGIKYKKNIFKNLKLKKLKTDKIDGYYIQDEKGYLTIICQKYNGNDYYTKTLDDNKNCNFPENETFYKNNIDCGDLPNLYNFKILTEASRSQIYFISSHPKIKSTFRFFNFKSNIRYVVVVADESLIFPPDWSKTIENLDNTDRLQLQFNSLAPSTPSVKL